jgi:magnesium-transporting ATPase (P-type)
MGKATQPSLEGHVSGQANKPLSKPAHALTFDQVIKETGCNADDGLTTSDAKSRHAEYGNNDLGDDAGVQPGKILLRQVANAMTLVSLYVFGGFYGHD